MSVPSNEVGKIGWVDLTIPDAENVRDFYKAVVGYKSGEVDMGGYADFNLLQPETGDVLAGVCHSRGVNEHLPAAWMIYINVANLEASMERCSALGGEVLSRPEPNSPYQIAVIRDPAGAVCALMEVQDAAEV